MSLKEKFSEGTTPIQVRLISCRHCVQIKRVSQANKLLFHSINTINLFFEQKIKKSIITIVEKKKYSLNGTYDETLIVTHDM